MINAVYFSYVVPLIFLVIVTKGEARNLVLFFAWGLTAALGVYGITGLLDAYTSISLPDQLVFVIPGLEELLKILPLFIVVFKADKKFKYSLVRYALAAGIGFSILENYLYLSLVSGEGANPITYIILRSLTACLLHGSASGLIGLGFQYMFNYRFFSPPLFFGVYIAATAVHGLYNLLGMTPRWMPLAFLIPVVFFVIEIFLLNAYGVRYGQRVPQVQEEKHEKP